MWTRPNTLSVRFKVDFCCGGCDPGFGFCRRHLRQEKPSPWITCRNTPGAFGRLSDRVHVTARRTEQTRPVQKARMPCSGHTGRPSLEAAAFATSRGTVRVDLRTGVTVWPVQARTQKEGRAARREANAYPCALSVCLSRLLADQTRIFLDQVWAFCQEFTGPRTSPPFNLFQTRKLPTVRV